MLDHFIGEENNKFLNFSSKDNNESESYKRRASATVNHSKSLSALKDFLGGEGPKQLVLVLAQEEGRIVEFSYALIYTDAHTQVRDVNTYIGTAWDYQGKGVGTELLRSHSEALLSKGITKYTTTVWERSRQLYDKLGIKYNTNPENPQQIIVDLTTLNTRETTSE